MDRALCCWNKRKIEAEDWLSITVIFYSRQTPIHKTHPQDQHDPENAGRNNSQRKQQDVQDKNTDQDVSDDF